ncbi:RNA-guided endonuclease TnpB family protein [Kitasatospora sp. NPDC058190]|uniref:RNA-guided endonuclease TnpB family protein n=1 Tax=Kitasatospora sp. NPDC058190 TaxID=3346371 RepID=UPI0036DCA209
MKKFEPQPGFVVQAFRFALDPNATQEAALWSHCGAARAAYNWAVGWVEASWWQRKAEESYGIPEADLTEWRPWSLPKLRKMFNEVKKTDPRFCGWWEENSKEAYSTGLANAAAAFDNYAESQRGERKGKTVGMPRFTSNKLLKRLSRRVSRRQGPAVYDPVTGRTTRREPSKRWLKANEDRNKVHHRVADLRTDALHKLTSGITAEYVTVVVEDLNVAGMLRNRRLARKIQDAGFGEIRRQITDKAGWTGGTTIVANRWYPSSKTCSNCGVVKAKLSLHVRVFTCDACGLVIDRDENAATNLAALAAASTTGTGLAGDPDARASKPRGADQKTRATRTRRTMDAGRAGGAVPQQRKETRDRHQDTQASRFGGTVTDLPGGNVRIAEA